MEAKTSRMRAKAVIGLLCCAIFAFGQTPVPFSTLPTYKGVTDTANDRIVFLKYNNGTGKYGNYIISPGTIEKNIVQDSGIAPGYGINKTNAKPRVLSADTTTSTGLVSKSRLTKAIAGAGTVKSVATGYGLSGGTITSTGNLVADTTVLASQARLTKSLALYQKSISLTTTGTSGSASFTSNTLNIPTYQSAYTNLTTIGGLSNTSGYLLNNGSGTFTYGNPIQDSGAANSWGLKITAAKPRLFKVDTATGNANGARLATQYWVTKNAPKGWGLTGNAGTTAGTNFIGTTDNVGLVFKVNNTLSGSIDIVNNNTSFGYSSLANNTSGSGKYNSALGYNALAANSTGAYNTAMGYNVASTNLSTGSNNIIIGSSCDMPVGGGAYSNSLILSSGSGATVNGSNMGVITNGSSYNLKLGVNQPTPTAALHVKGTGTTSSTNTLRVENSSNTVALQVNDGGFAAFGMTPTNDSRLQIQGTSSGSSYSSLRVYNSSSFETFNCMDNGGVGMLGVHAPSAGYLTIGAPQTLSGINVNTATNGLSRVINGSAEYGWVTNGYGSYGNFAPTSLGGAYLDNTNGGPTLISSRGGSIYFGSLTGTTNIMQIATGTSKISMNGQISINTTTPDASAIIDIETTTQGFLAPQMTTTQKNSISSPKEGLMVYDLTLHKLSYYNGSSWTNL